MPATSTSIRDSVLHRNQPVCRSHILQKDEELLVGERFVWAHLPKAGGDATAAMFRLFPHLIVHADDTGTNPQT